MLILLVSYSACTCIHTLQACKNIFTITVKIKTDNKYKRMAISS